MTEALRTAQTALAANDAAATVDAFYDLVRNAIRIVATAEKEPDLGTEANPLRLGNVEFWQEGDTMLYLPASSQWDRTALNSALTRILSLPSDVPEPFRYVVAFLDNDPRSALLLSNIQRNSYGRIKSGFVTNGGWTLSIKKDVMLCNGADISREGVKMTTPLVEVSVPDRLPAPFDTGYHAFYEAAIAWASTQPGAPRAQQDANDEAEEESAAPGMTG